MTGNFEGGEPSSISSRGATTDGARLFVSTLGFPEEMLAVNVSSRRWKRLATLPRGQRWHCSEWHGGVLYVAGGLGSEDHGIARFLRSVFAFSETTGSWEELPPMPHACALAASGVIGNQLFIAGGQGTLGHEGIESSELSTLQIYDIANRTWRLGPPLPGPFSDGIGLVMDGRLFLVSSGDLLIYDPRSDTWTESRTYYPSNQMHHACVHNNRIIVFLDLGTAWALAADGSWTYYEDAMAFVGPPARRAHWPQNPEHYVSESVLLG